MYNFKVKGVYTYKVEKIVEANNEQEAIDIALDSVPMCEWILKIKTLILRNFNL